MGEFLLIIVSYLESKHQGHQDTKEYSRVARIHEISLMCNCWDFSPGEDRTKSQMGKYFRGQSGKQNKMNPKTLMGVNKPADNSPLSSQPTTTR